MYPRFLAWTGENAGHALFWCHFNHSPHKFSWLMFSIIHTLNERRCQWLQCKEQHGVLVIRLHNYGLSIRLSEKLHVCNLPMMFSHYAINKIRPVRIFSVRAWDYFEHPFRSILEHVSIIFESIGPPQWTHAWDFQDSSVSIIYQDMNYCKSRCCCILK